MFLCMAWKLVKPCDPLAHPTPVDPLKSVEYTLNPLPLIHSSTIHYITQIVAVSNYITFVLQVSSHMGPLAKH